jgi:hypothetical protein
MSTIVKPKPNPNPDPDPNPNPDLQSDTYFVIMLYRGLNRQVNRASDKKAPI